jgi:hypothetical protein
LILVGYSLAEIGALNMSTTYSSVIGPFKSIGAPEGVQANVFALVVGVVGVVGDFDG